MISKKVWNNNRKRLRRLRRLRDVVIPAIDIEHLNFRNWKCGTFMCLAGFACVDNGFKRAGLGFGVKFYTKAPVYTNEEGELQHSFAALRTFFMLEHKETHFMFGSQFAGGTEAELSRRKVYLGDLIKKYGGNVNITYAESV